MKPLEVGFLSVVGAKLRAEMFTAGRPPRFKITVAKREWLITKGAACGATVQVPAVRAHESPLSSEGASHVAVFRESLTANITQGDWAGVHRLLPQMQNHSRVAAQHHNSNALVESWRDQSPD